jgi:hypothetical protein
MYMILKFHGHFILWSLLRHFGDSLCLHHLGVDMMSDTAVHSIYTQFLSECGVLSEHRQLREHWAQSGGQSSYTEYVA